MDFIQNNSKTCISCDICFNFDVIYPKQNITGNVAVKSTEYCILQQVIIEVNSFLLFKSYEQLIQLFRRSVELQNVNGYAINM